MTEQERGFAPTDPSTEDDLLAPEPRAGAPEGEETDEATDVEGEPEEGAEESGEETRPRSSRRQFVVMGWVAVAVIAIIGALIIVELVRISNAVNNNGCILRAQASFLQAQGPGVSPGYASLDRLTGQNQLKTCTQ
jgi:hypothetical protein